MNSSPLRRVRGSQGRRGRAIHRLRTAGVVIAALALAATWTAGAAQSAVPGTVVAWGCGGGDNYGQCNVPSGLAGVIAIAANDGSSLALRSNGTVAAWGCASGNSGHAPCRAASRELPRSQPGAPTASR